MDEQEIIQLLSEMHKDHSTDPRTLFAANFRDFDRNHPRYPEHLKLQGDLFYFCWERNEPWTEKP